MHTKEQQQLAKSVIENKALFEFLVSVLVEPQQAWTQEVIGMPNEQLGELVKADVMAQQKIVERFNNIKRMATETGGSSAPIAPK